MNKLLLFIPLLMLLQTESKAQYPQQQYTCESAINQLSNYYQQVEYAYSQNYYWIAYNVDPYYQQSYYYSLEDWYAQQIDYCTGVYYQIMESCDVQQPTYPMEEELPRPQGQPQGQMASHTQPQTLTTLSQTRVVEEDKRKKVRLEIPTNPIGWQH